jgi:hypothetical protein
MLKSATLSCSMSQETDDNIVFADGFDDAIVGVLNIDGSTRVVYDKWAMVNVMRCTDPEVTFDDALEFLEYNVWGSYIGPNTPIYMYCVHGSGEERKEELLDYVYDTLW